MTRCTKRRRLQGQDLRKDARRQGKNGRIVFSFSSGPESDEPCFDVERSTSANIDAFVTAAASFTWRNSSVPDIEVGRRDPAVVVAGGVVPGRPSMKDVDGTRAWEIPVGNVAWRAMRAVE